MMTNGRQEAASDPTLVRVCDNLVLHLERKPLPDPLFVDTYRLLAERVLRSLPEPVAEDLRGAPDSGRATLAEALAGLLQSDPDVRQLVRVILTPPGCEVRGHKKRKDKIRILFLSSQPDLSRPAGLKQSVSLPFLRVDREIRQVQEVLKKEKRFELSVRPAVRVLDLPWCLLEHEPHILHVSCHGTQGSLLFERHGDGTDWSVDGEHLAKLFGIWKGPLRCVVLNACESARQAEPIAREVGAVVARPEVVDDSAAVLFSEQFYQGITHGRTLSEAIKLACWQLEAAGCWGPSALPQLLGEAQELRFVNERN
jgi:hypothetical protein